MSVYKCFKHGLLDVGCVSCYTAMSYRHDAMKDVLRKAARLDVPLSAKLCLQDAGFPGEIEIAAHEVLERTGLVECEKSCTKDFKQGRNTKYLKLLAFVKEISRDDLSDATTSCDNGCQYDYAREAQQTLKEIGEL